MYFVKTLDLSTARPPVLVFMINASLAWILIIIWKPYRSIIIFWPIIGLGDSDSGLHRHDLQVNTIDGPTKLVRPDAILGGLSMGHFFMVYLWGNATTPSQWWPVNPVWQIHSCFPWFIVQLPPCRQGLFSHIPPPLEDTLSKVKVSIWLKLLKGIIMQSILGAFDSMLTFYLNRNIFFC